MLKAPKDYAYNPIPESKTIEFRIEVNDQLQIRLFSNDGFKIIDLSQSPQAVATANVFTYRVEHDGVVKLPILGRIPISGMTLREAEALLEEKYSAYYVKPFVLLSVQNRKVFLFPGADGAARSIPLSDENVTLVQALAYAGGITNNGKAYRIKLIRGDPKNPQVYLFDLSTIEGFKQSGIPLQSNDIIYVEPVSRYGKGLIAEIGPYLSIATSLLVAITLLSRVNN